MGFTQAVSHCFSHYATFSGRALRSEFWFFVLFYAIVSFALSFIDSILFGVSLDGWGVLGLLFFLGTFLPYLAVSVRRLHDGNHSGLHVGVQWAGFIVVALAFNAGAGGLAAIVSFPLIIHFVVVLVWVIQRGTAGGNFYGPPHGTPPAEPVLDEETAAALREYQEGENR